MTGPGGAAGGRAPKAAEHVGTLIHDLHGTRSLAAAGVLVLLLTLTEPVLPDLVVPGLSGLAVVLLVLGVLTLPRETAAAQQRLATALGQPGTQRLLGRLLVLPALLLILLLPRLFLAAYGIPHLTPASGLLLPSIVNRVALVFLAAVLLVPILGFRQVRHRLGHGPVPRPRDLAATDIEDDRRELLLAGVVVLGIVWLWLLEAFWTPFSLLAWPPRLASLDSARGVTAIAFTIVVPAVLFAGTAIHAELLRAAWRLERSRRRSSLLVLAGAHLLLLFAALALHAYDLLWIAKYQSASGG